MGFVVGEILWLEEVSTNPNLIHIKILDVYISVGIKMVTVVFKYINENQDTGTFKVQDVINKYNRYPPKGHKIKLDVYTR